MAEILIVYSTVDGHTRKIALKLREWLEQPGHSVTLVAIEDVALIDLRRFAAIVIGASIRYGKHRPQVQAFIADHLALLQARPSAFFSVNAVARKPERRTPETNPYVHRFLQQISWQPRLCAVFGGKIDYPRYNVFDRSLIRLIMWMTGGPTDPRTVVEFTDWEAVELFARDLQTLLAGANPPALEEPGAPHEQILNFRQMSADMATSGQPDANQFAHIAAEGYQVVINLAMPDSSNALHDEGYLVTLQGMRYIHIPVSWEAPQLRDFEDFCTLVQALSGQRLWVHCALNMRVSCFVYLYRRRLLGEPEEQAHKAMQGIWEPEGVWADFVQKILTAA